MYQIPPKLVGPQYETPVVLLILLHLYNNVGVLYFVSLILKSYFLHEGFKNNGVPSNFPVGLAPQKKPPATHQICRKTIGKMLLGIDLWGPFFGVANHQETYKFQHLFLTVGF
jgi:hypothetical protein